VTIFEHAMCGATLALALGCQRRYGWALVAAAGAAAALPDWDGLSLAFGAAAYAQGHRVWGHNLLVAGTTGAIVGGLGYLCYLSTQVRRAAVRLRSPPGMVNIPPPFSARHLAAWILICICASLSHLPADLVYSGHPRMMSWPLPLLWPFSERTWVLPLVAWGDLTTTLIFVAEMFALYRWPGRAQVIAVLTLLAVMIYVGICWLRLSADGA
jgi:membrane-bound metal-dependent hydrolase YbcI (DUF457 family)